LHEWKLLCPKGDLGLVFPTGSGNVESHSNIVQRGFDPIQITAGVATLKEAKDKYGQPIIGEDGKPTTVPAGKYGLHSLRHACASLWIENGMNPKRIQNLMGHSTIQMTFDTYGHLFTDAKGNQRAARYSVSPAGKLGSVLINTRECPLSGQSRPCNCGINDCF
jgi:integrase